MNRGAVALLEFGLLPGIGSSDSTRTIALRYDAALAKGDFPNPAARLTVNGEKVRGVDSTGRPYPFRGLHDLAARLDDGSDLTLRVAGVADFPAEFRQSEIGVVVNPQLLAGEGRAAALDLRVPELRIESLDRAVQRLGARVLSRDQLQVCGSTKDAVPNLLFAITVGARGRQGTLLVDSGAGVTKLVKKSALLSGVRLAPGGQATGLAGKPQPFRLARGLEMSFSARVHGPGSMRHHPHARALLAGQAAPEALGSPC